MSIFHLDNSRLPILDFNADHGNTNNILLQCNTENNIIILLLLLLLSTLSSVEFQNTACHLYGARIFVEVGEIVR